MYQPAVDYLMRFLDWWIPPSSYEDLTQDPVHATRLETMGEEKLVASLKKRRTLELVKSLRPIAGAMLFTANNDAADRMYNILPGEGTLVFPRSFQTNPPSRLLRLFPPSRVRWNYSSSNSRRVVRAIVLHVNERSPSKQAEISLVLEPFTGGPIRTVIQINTVGHVCVSQLHGAYFHEVSGSNIGLIPFQRGDYRVINRSIPEDHWPAKLGTETLRDDLAVSLPALPECLKRAVKEL